MTRWPLFMLLPDGGPRQLRTTEPFVPPTPSPSIENAYLKVSLTENPPQVLLRNRKGQVLLRVCGNSVLDSIRRTKAFLDAKERDPGPEPETP